MTRNKKIVAYLTMAIIACISVYAVGAAGWDRDDASFSVGAINADVWNSCSDGTDGIHAAGYCVTTTTNATARLEISAYVNFVDEGRYTYKEGPINSTYCSRTDGAGIRTSSVESFHYVNGKLKVLYTNCR